MPTKRADRRRARKVRNSAIPKTAALPLIMKTARLLDYWQKSGQWPDSCFETDMPYDCKKEAAKLKV
jgi:hypothetical protein